MVALSRFVFRLWLVLLGLVRGGLLGLGLSILS